MLLALVLASVTLPSAQAHPSPAEIAPQSVSPHLVGDTAAPAPALQAFSRALAFVPAGGQGRNAELRFEVRGAHGTLFLTPRETIFALPTTFPPRTRAATAANEHATQQAMGVVRQRFVGAAAHPKLSGLEQQPGIVNDYIGDPSAWRTQVPTYAAVRFYALYPGIDLRYDGQDGQLKRSFFVAPGADPTAIQWRYQGVDSMTIDPTSGDLQLHITVRLTPTQQAQLDTPQRTMAITMTERAPRAWQDTPQGRVAVPVQFALGHGQSVQFALAAYDHGLPLTIDPTIVYSQAFGGNASDTLYDMVLDNTGQLIVVGSSTSTDFGTTTYGSHTILGNSYAIASAVISDTGQLLWTTRLGNNNKSSQAFSVTRGSPTGNVADTIVMGGTTEGDYPATTGICSRRAATLTRLETVGGTQFDSSCWEGSYSGGQFGRTSVGSTSDDRIWMAVNYSGEFNKPWAFPDTGVTASYGGGSQLPTGIYVVRVNSSLSSAELSVGLGGAADRVNDLVVDSADRPIVVGKAASRLNQSGAPLFLTTGDAIQGSSAHSYAFLIGDMFATRLTTTGGLDYSTFLSGSHYDEAEAVSLAEDGQWLVGGSSSPAGGSTAPLTSTAWSTSGSAYVARINPAISGLNGLTYGSLLGGGIVRNLAARADRISVVGSSTDDTMFGSVTPLLAHMGGGAQNGFAATLETTQPGLPFATFLPSYTTAPGLVLSVGGDLLVGGVEGSGSATQMGVTRINTSNIQAQSMILSITDAKGQPVSGLLKNADGWPLLNASGSGEMANPLTVTALVSNPSTETQNMDVLLEIGADSLTAGHRFYVYNPPPLNICSSTYTGSLYSQKYFSADCTFPAVPAGQYRTLQWHVWVQPSVHNQLTFVLRIYDQTNQLVSRTPKSVEVPQAHIRPVVVVPGIIGSYPKDGVWVLDPLTGAYSGLVENLYRMGYESDNTLITFPYQWYGKLRDMSEKNNIEELAVKLRNKIDGWWTPGHPAPAYVNNAQFDLVAHSTGGIITRYYVTILGDANKLHTVELVAVPNQGSPSAYYGWEGGEIYASGIEKFMLQDVLLRSLSKKAGCSSWGGAWAGNEEFWAYIRGMACSKGPQPGIPLIGQLLPSTLANQQHPYLYRLATTDTKMGPVNPLLNTLNTTTNVDNFVQAIHNNGTLNDGKLYVVYESLVPTLRMMDYVPIPSDSPLWMYGEAVVEKDYDNIKALERIPSIGSDDTASGDSTVPSWSANLQEIASQDAYVTAVKLNTAAIKHTELFNDLRSGREIIARVVNSGLGAYGDQDTWIKSLPFTVPASIPSYETVNLIWSNECPVTMLITDPQGRRIGSLPNGQIVNEIPDGFYTGDLPGDEPEQIIIPTPLVGTYTVTVTGQRADPFEIKALLMSDNAMRRVGRFTGIAQPAQVLSTAMNVFSFTAPQRSLLVDDGSDIGTISRYQSALTQLGRSADLWQTAQQGLPTLTDMYAYDSVLWATGANAMLSNAQMLALGIYAGDGGGVLVSGQNTDAGITNTVVLSQTLHMGIANPTTNSQILQGSDLLTGLSLHLNGGDSANNQTSPSALSPFAGVVSLANYTDGSGANQVAALRRSLFSGRMIYLGFGIEGLQTGTERVAVLDRLLRWLDTGETPATAFPTTPILDSFTRTDGPIGSDWLGATQNYSIAGNMLENVGGNTDPIFWQSSFGADQEVFTTITSMDATASEVDLVLKAQDTTPCNLIEVWYQPSRGTAQVWTCHTWGTWTQHGSDIPLSLAAGDQFGARAQADGTVTVYKNGTAVGSATIDSSWPYVAHSGRVGIWLIDAPNIVLDDVGGGTRP